MRPPRPALFVLALALLAGCDFGPNDDPLPTRAELVAAFGPQEVGTASVRETGGRDGRYGMAAGYYTSVITGSESTIVRFILELDGEDLGVYTSLANTGASDLASGDGFEPLFNYNPQRGDGGSGLGRLYITAVGGGRVEGVFAADITPGGLVPVYSRVTGAFNAALDPKGGAGSAAR